MSLPKQNSIVTGLLYEHGLTEGIMAGMPWRDSVLELGTRFGSGVYLIERAKCIVLTLS